MVKRINMYEVWTTQVVKVQIGMNGSYAILRNWKTQSVFEDFDWNKKAKVNYNFGIWKRGTKCIEN